MRIPQNIKIVDDDDISAVESAVTMPVNLMRIDTLRSENDETHKDNVLDTIYTETEIETIATNIMSQEIFDVSAPRGRSGLIIDTTNFGPIVYAVKPNSALFGIISKGDFILAIDGIDTTRMSVQSLTELMGRCRSSTIQITFKKNEEEI